MGFMMPSRMAIIPEIVSAEQVMNAISLSAPGQTVFRLAEPALAGFLIDTYGFAAIYYLMTGLYLVSTIFAIKLPRTGQTTGKEGNPLRDVIDGIRYIRRDTAILMVVVFGLLHVICGQPFMQLMPAFTDDILEVGATGLGILMTVSGAGAVLGSLVLASLPNRRRGVLLLLSSLE